MNKTVTTEINKKTTKKNRKIFDLEKRKLFLMAFRGDTKGTINRELSKRIDRALVALEDAGYV